MARLTCYYYNMDDMVEMRVPQPVRDQHTPVIDIYERPLRDLRISVTDRCNLRCRYCMPKELFGMAYKFMPVSELLTFEEIARITRCLVRLGVEKVRLTGGEPLVRRNLEELIAAITDTGITDIAVTTNGVLLTDKKARAFKAAGLSRITVSLDALEPDVFQHITGSTVKPERVLAAIDAANAAGLDPVKINMVVQRGVNEKSILPMAEHFRGTGHILRFIEFMDVGTSNGWLMKDVVPADDIRELIDSEWPLERLPKRYSGEVAQRYRYRDGGGDIGLIASVTKPFCGACTRLRLTADGKFYTCLFANAGHDLRGDLRAGISDAEIEDRIAAIWTGRADRYSELRTQFGHEESKRREMWQIGG
ncbi:MAG: GTP 3',8-cyclase MoaA [Gammaproteobacteria bacterium]